MKKIYMFSIAVVTTATSFAQRTSQEAPFSFSIEKANHQINKGVGDTIINHAVGTPALFTASSGFVAGQNNFGDLSKMQLFDSNNGLTTTNGNITNVLFWFGHVEGNPSSFVKATIWADNAGLPGAVLGTVNVPFSAIDTSAANLMTNGVVAWNAVATFVTPIAIPTNQKFWAGIDLIYAAGDTVGLVTTSDATPGDAPGITGDFLLANTHTFEQWSDNSFHSFNDGTTNTWQLDVAMAIFPVLDITTSIKEEKNNQAINVYPNPSNGIFTIDMKNSTVTNLFVKNIVGQTVLSKNVNVSGTSTITVSLENQPKGVYFLSINNQTLKLIVE